MSDAPPPWSARLSPQAADTVKELPDHARAVGQLTAVYWINRPAGRLYVVDIVWLG